MFLQKQRVCSTLEPSSNSDNLDLSQLTPQQIDKHAIKADLPIGYVLELYGLDVSVVEGELLSLCPFHDDTNPSLHVFGENLDYWRCMSCIAQGDVTAFIQKMDNLTFPEALFKASSLIPRSEGWTGPREGVKKSTLTTAEATEVIQASHDQLDLDVIETLIADKQYPFSAQWLIDTFLVGTWNDRLVIPYIAKDGQFVAYKTRTSHTKPRAAAGSTFAEILYSEYSLGEEKPVLLCGSESDVWVGTYVLGHMYDVVGAPTGETANPIQAAKLANRQVYIAFDGDNAGRVGAARWREALEKNGATVYTVILPEGEDVASISDLEFHITSARRIALPVPDSLKITGFCYHRTTGTQLSNWIFEPRVSVQIDGGGGEMFQGVIHPTGEIATLTVQDCQSRGALVRWCNRHNVSWFGSEKEAQLIWAALQGQRHLLETTLSTHVTGLYKDTFIWANGKIGSSAVSYTSPQSDVAFEKHIQIDAGECTPEHIYTLRGLNKREVMDPILAWLALSMLRSKFTEFPSLGVMGSAGTGKSTTLSTVVPLLVGSSYSLTLTGTTPYALNAALGATNAWPVHVDEFRDEARRETKDKMNQFIRDGYNGYGSQRGGGKEGWAAVDTIDITAPMIISGETSFTETSHIERIIYVTMPYNTANPGALETIRSWRHPGIAYQYLTWLTQGLSKNRWDFTQPIVYAGAGDLPYRIRYNLGLLTFGWTLLQDFVSDLGSTLSAPDFTGVEAKLREMIQKAPIEEAIRWAVGIPDSGADIVEIDDCIYINVHTLYAVIQRNGSFKMPGDAEAISAYLRARYGATHVVRHTLLGRPETVLKVTRQLYDVN